MKQIITSILIFISLSLSAQSEVKFLNAFGEVPINSVSDLLANSITLCINDNVSEVTRSEAVQQLSSFMNGQNIIKKKILHDGKSTDKDSSYKVARVKTNNGTYRVFAYAELVNGKSVVKEVRIDKM